MKPCPKRRRRLHARCARRPKSSLPASIPREQSASQHPPRAVCVDCMRDAGDGLLCVHGLSHGRPGMSDAPGLCCVPRRVLLLCKLRVRSLSRPSRAHSLAVYASMPRPGQVKEPPRPRSSGPTRRDATRPRARACVRRLVPAQRFRAVPARVQDARPAVPPPACTGHSARRCRRTAARAGCL